MGDGLAGVVEAGREVIGRDVAVRLELLDVLSLFFRVKHVKSAYLAVYVSHIEAYSTAVGEAHSSKR